MRKLSLLVALAMLTMLALAPAALAQNTLNCSDFPSQAAAQANLTQNPSDPNRLDANNNGVACEDYGYPAGTPTNMTPVAPNQTTTTTPPKATTPASATPAQTATPTSPAATTSTAPKLAKSGGPELLIPAVALLMGSGLLVLGLMRRNS